MSCQSDRVTIGKQLEQLIKLQILDIDSTSSNESDLEMLDLLGTDADSADSSSDSDRDQDILDDSDSDSEDDIADLDALREALQHSIYFTRGVRDSSSSPASRQSGSPAHAVASSSEASSGPDRRVASA
ncbi:hypothetical protein R1sor_010213 [Riccia sorocarpa]|uniref:Uncharacterized protein n=1 Tax=Riccia sorocarpa TaxID=122646 RepID=A0ABD3HXC3_9MARC